MKSLEDVSFSPTTVWKATVRQEEVRLITNGNSSGVAAMTTVSHKVCSDRKQVIRKLSCKILCGHSVCETLIKYLNVKITLEIHKINTKRYSRLSLCHSPMNQCETFRFRTVH
jgi:hypothetical protein